MGFAYQTLSSSVVKIRSSFETEGNFHHLSSVDELDEPLLRFKKFFREDNDSTTPSNNDNKIVMDNVSGLANKLNNFSRKFGYS